MSDIRFNRWLHQSGTGGVYQDSTGRVGIGTSVPTTALDVQSGIIKIGSNTLSSSGVSTFTTVNANSVISNSVSATSIVGVNTLGVTTAFINNLGIGTATVSQPLYVVGNAKVTGPISSKNCAFHAEASVPTTLAAGTQTKITFGSESFDSNSNYDASNSRFTPTVAGWYFLRSNVRADINSNSVLHLYFYKNGTTDFGIGNFISVTSSQATTVGTAIGFFNGTTDYAEVRVFSGVVGNTSTGISATFSGFLISPTAF